MAVETRSGATLFVEILDRYGIEYLFGNPGTTELPLMRALEGSGIEYVLGLHEDVAVGAAAGYALTRVFREHGESDSPPVGVVNLHNAPGLAHGLGNLYAANFAGAPIVVTSGMHGTDFQHDEPKLHGDVVAMAAPHTKGSAEVKHIDALPDMLRRAIRTAVTPPPGPVFLGLPLNVMNERTDGGPRPLGSIPVAGTADAACIEAAAAILADEEYTDIAFVMGDNAAHAHERVDQAAVRLAEVTGARVYSEVLTTAINFPTAHPQFAAALPTDDRAIARFLDADVVVFVECSTNTTLTRPEVEFISGPTRVIHLGANTRELGKLHHGDVALLGDPGAVMNQLAETLEGRMDPAITADRLAAVRASNAGHDPEPADDGEGGISLETLADAVGTVANEVLIVDESVSLKPILLQRVDLSPGGFLGNKGAGLGFGLPAAVGAALAEREAPDSRPVLGLIGDGSFLYYPQAIYTAARHQLDLTVVIPNNRGYRVLERNMDLMFGVEAGRTYLGTRFDPVVDIVENAESMGAEGQRITDPTELEPVLARETSTSGLSVIDVHIRDDG